MKDRKGTTLAGDLPRRVARTQRTRNVRQAPPLDNREPTLKDLERALAMAAYIVLRHGHEYAPILDRLEREVERARKDDPQVRARRILERYTSAGGRKAILLTHE